MPNSKTDGPAQKGWTYRFAQGQFAGAPGGLPQGYNALNRAGRTLGFGLMQQAGVNNVSVFAPLCATEVANDIVGVFLPVEAVVVFVSPLASAGLVLEEIPADALAVPPTPARPVAALGYRDATRTFYPIGETAAAETFGSPHAIAGPLASARA